MKNWEFLTWQSMTALMLVLTQRKQGSCCSSKFIQSFPQSTFMKFHNLHYIIYGSVKIMPSSSYQKCSSTQSFNVGKKGDSKLSETSNRGQEFTWGSSTKVNPILLHPWNEPQCCHGHLMSLFSQFQFVGKSHHIKARIHSRDVNAKCLKYRLHNTSIQWPGAFKYKAYSISSCHHDVNFFQVKYLRGR